MSEQLDNLSIRLKYAGGAKAESRFQNDKLRTLKKALLYSYQAETAVLSDNREFRCLINSDKLKNDYDNKILSIPFEDICLNQDKIGTTTEGIQETGMKVGDVFKWKETDTFWIVYLRFLEENAYFRGEIRRCSSIATVNGIDYYVYMRGPVETTIRWNQKSDIVWNDLNYSAIVYITLDENTSKLKRFSKIKLDGQNYEVKVVNRYTSGGILIVYLGEDYSNSIEDDKLQRDEIDEDLDFSLYEIKGKTKVSPYDLITYSLDADIDDGVWETSNLKAKVVETGEKEVTIEVLTGRAGKFDLLYTRPNGIQYALPITVEAF